MELYIFNFLNYNININNLKIKLITLGRTKNNNIKELINDYYNKLNHYVNFEIITIEDVKKIKNKKIVLQKEGEMILSKLKKTDLLVLLDEKGKSYSSVEFSKYLQKLLVSGKKNICFVIGGPFGFSDEIKKIATHKVSFSEMTFPHDLIRLFFTEQLYRGFSILKNEPYHHN